MPAINRKEPNDLVLSSTTETQEQIEHAVSENWKEPFVPAKEKEAAAKAEKEAAEKILADAKLAEEAKDAKEPETGKGKESEVEDGEADELGPANKQEAKRINRLTIRNARIQEELRTEREARERLEQRLATLERGGKPAEEVNVPEGATADLPGKPKRIEFKDEDTYVEKLIQWTKANEEYKEGAQAANEHAKKIFVAHSERIDEARDKYDDWDTVAKGAMNMHLPLAVDFAIREMDNSADVLYHIAKNPKVYEKMSAMSPSQQVIEAGRISDRLMAGNGANGNGRQRKPREAAPEPITPGGRRSTAQGKKLEDMSADEYYRARLAMRAARRAN